MRASCYPATSLEGSAVYPLLHSQAPSASCFRQSASELYYFLVLPQRPLAVSAKTAWHRSGSSDTGGDSEGHPIGLVGHTALGLGKTRSLLVTSYQLPVRIASTARSYESVTSLTAVVGGFLKLCLISSTWQRVPLRCRRSGIFR